MLATISVAQAQQERMNFVFFLVDDLGWADVGCFGSSFHETPNIDRLSASGMRFSRGYAACPVCSPTRASILTGKHPVRVDITDWIPGMRVPLERKPKFLHIDDRENLALEEETIAERLKAGGYKTFFAGKWHLGEEGHWPTDQGFDFNIGGNSRGSPPGGYYAPWKNPALRAQSEDEYLTERLTDESCRFLEQMSEAKEPFFLYLSYYNVHTPITPYRKFEQHFEAKAKEQFLTGTPELKERSGVSRGRQDNPAFASMVSAVDESVGSVLKRLRELKLHKNTAVIFFSDNGGLCTKPKPGPTCNLPLRSGKGWLYEGGVREPTILFVPGLTKAGSVCEEPIVSMDFFPTIAKLAGLDQQHDQQLDGVDITPLLGGRSIEPRSLYWHYPHYHGSTWSPGASIVKGDWKLIEFYEHEDVELYKLKTDMGEQQNLASKNPELVEELRHELREWQQASGAKMPVLNPAWKK